MTLFSICDLLDWPWLLLWWLLPFLLGLLLGWLLWAGYKRRLEDALRINGELKNRIKELEAELEACRSKGASLNNDIISLRAEINEYRRSEDQSIDLKAAAIPVPVASTSKVSASVYAGLKPDQLQVVEGIGPKMESVLKEKGINNWADLASNSPEDIRAILDSYGAKYKIIDPITWPEQASLARDGKWEALIARQKELSGGTMEVSNVTDSKVEKMLIKLGLLKKYKKNDLKAIEGIGPKIEGLLHAAGIKTWLDLSNADVKHLNQILEDAGPRYKLADPATWPTQSQFAHEGRWKELEEYQDFLQGGRES